MFLDEFTRRVAGVLAEGWRFELRNTAPVIINDKVGWLIFDDSDPDVLRVTLKALSGHEPACEIRRGTPVSITALRIHRQLIEPHQTRIADTQARLAWWTDWCRRFEQWAATQHMRVEFAADKDGDKILNLRAVFFDAAIHAPAPWGVITVSYDGFPARVEYYTRSEALRDKLDAIVQQAGAPTVETGRHKRGRRRLRAA